MFMSRAAMTEREVIRDLHHVTGGGLKEKIIEQHKLFGYNYVMYRISIISI